MWFERPKPSDGLILSTVIGVVACALGSILTPRTVDKAPARPTLSCQEVVVTVEKRGSVLARCPSGTHLDIIDGEYVVCRCQEVRQPKSFESDPGSNDLPQTDEDNQEEQTPQPDDPGISL